ncbi:HPP family protein [Propionivibrio sp.]|uniref:CBS domain-containing protein n=1 Tax=Propionivibrio sp. TaxID=2212460 RepID=UPI0039E48C0D
MFSLYGLSGPLFTGTLEALGRLPPVTRRGPAAAVRAVEERIESAEGGAAPAAQTTPARQAVEAYQSMLPENLERGPLYHAEQIMQPRVITVGADDDVARAWHVLVGHQIHQAPVLDAGRRLVGIVSERNLLTTLNVEDGQVRDVLQKRVADVMTTPVVAAHPLTDIRRIARVMLERNVDGVPIVDDGGALAGFVSRSDILNAVVRDPPLSMWR